MFAYPDSQSSFCSIQHGFLDHKLVAHDTFKLTFSTKKHYVGLVCFFLMMSQFVNGKQLNMLLICGYLQLDDACFT